LTGFAAAAVARTGRRVDCDGRRLAPETGFFIFRRIPVGLFFVR
jgi:hypothetical protein